MASASLCDACCRRTPAAFIASAPPESSAFLASAIADSRAPTSDGSSFALLYWKAFSVE
jgi:hypothetical protein